MSDDRDEPAEIPVDAVDDLTDDINVDDLPDGMFDFVELRIRCPRLMVGGLMTLMQQGGVVTLGMTDNPGGVTVADSVTRQMVSSDDKLRQLVEMESPVVPVPVLGDLVDDMLNATVEELDE